MGQNDPKRCQFELEGTEGSKQVRLLACLVNTRTTVWMLLLCNRLISLAQRWLEDDLMVFSAFGSHCSAEVSLLVRCSLNVIVNLVFAGDGGRLVVADVAVKSFEFRVIAVYAPNSTSQRCSFFRRFRLFLDDSKRTVLVDDWNAILDPKIDKGGRGASGSGRCENSLIDLMVDFNLIDRFRLDHPGRKIWTWLGNSSDGQIQSLDRVLEELTVTSLLVPHSTS